MTNEIKLAHLTIGGVPMPMKLEAYRKRFCFLELLAVQQAVPMEQLKKLWWMQL